LKSKNWLAGRQNDIRRLDGLHSKLRDIRGHDSFQALMLAQRLAHQLLTAHVDKGGKLLDGPAGSPVSVDALFNSGTLI
jgi:hypothetical protein